MTIQNKRLLGILVAVFGILMIPLIAMQFTEEVQWTFGDFLVAGVLLLSTGLIGDFVIRKVKNSQYRIAICIALFIIFILIWAELAVGIFGTPFAGS